LLILKIFLPLGQGSVPHRIGSTVRARCRALFPFKGILTGAASVKIPVHSFLLPNDRIRAYVSKKQDKRKETRQPV
jgi:hypothetical protein